MKNIKPFGPSIGKTKISKRFINKLNEEFDKKSNYRKIDYIINLQNQCDGLKFNKLKFFCF